MRKHQGATVSDLLREGTRELRKADSDSPGLDAEILLREALGVTREQLFEALPLGVRPDGSSRYRELIQQRIQGIPVAYIIGRREFYGRDFVVNEHVLVPRPESEFIVERAVAWLDHHGGNRRVVDVGTGSGAIAISIACETADRHVVVGSDVSLPALSVARANRDAHHPGVHLVAGSLLEWWRGPVDFIAANLPYLRPDQAHVGIEFEPEIALYAGNDGFALNDRLIRQAAAILASPGRLIMEIDPSQADQALETGRAAFPGDDVMIQRDLAGSDRYLIVDR
jgi:release factor glutamine methyltransferase